MSRATPPVLFLIFNRPDHAAQSFECIRAARPAKLFVAADGPRNDRPHETDLCEESRNVVSRVDWPCEVKTLFRDENLGCRGALSSAIDWFFENVEEGIILEDDCVADLSFFRFCSELLQLYRADDRIMVISGNNHQKGTSRTSASYYFSKYPHVWGWATWRSAWGKMDVRMTQWPQLKARHCVSSLCRSAKEREYWTNIFDRTFLGEIDSWAYAWTLACWQHGGLTVLPDTNLVRNIGWGEDATHTKGSGVNLLTPVQPVPFPLHHPASISINRKADRFTDRIFFGGVRVPLSEMLVRFRWRLSAVIRRILDRMV